MGAISHDEDTAQLAFNVSMADIILLNARLLSISDTFPPSGDGYIEDLVPVVV